MSAAGTALEGARVVVGAADLLAPGAITAGTAFPSALYRVLGTRQVLQGLLTGHPVGHRTSGGVDVLHAASMVVVAAVSTRYRSAALVQVAQAGAFAAAELTIGRRG